MLFYFNNAFFIFVLKIFKFLHFLRFPLPERGKLSKPVYLDNLEIKTIFHNF